MEHLTETKNEITHRLKKFAVIGYNQRIGAVILTGSKRCDGCTKKGLPLSGFEKDYPTNNDIWLCAECIMELTNV